MYRNIGGSAKLFSSNKTLFWLIIFIAISCFVYIFSDICFSFSAGFLLAYIFVPFVNKGSKYINRTLLSFVCAIGLISGLTAIIINVIPIVIEYVVMFSNNAPIYMHKVSELISQVGDSIGLPSIRETLRNPHIEMLKYVDQKMIIVSSLAKGIISQCYALTGAVSFFIIMILSFFYFLKDWNLLKSYCYKFVPIRQKEIFREVGILTRKTLHNFLQGQLCVVIVLSVYYGGFLIIIGIDHFIALGVMSGMFSFIPFIGALLALFIVIFINATSLSLIHFYGLIAVYLFGQLLEGYVLSPRLVGKTTGLHPLWILFSFFAGYQLKGVIGVLVAIPFTAVINKLAIFALNKFRESQAYKQ